MVDAGRTIGYGMQGASAGWMMGGPIGAGIGGAIGLLGGLFMKSPEELRQEAFNDYLRELGRIRKEAVNDARILGSGVISQMTKGAKMRAQAAGVTGVDAQEAFTLPAQEQGVKAVNQNISAVNREFDNKELEARAGFAGRPIEPNPMDYLMEGAAALGGVITQQKAMDKLSNAESSFAKALQDLRNQAGLVRTGTDAMSGVNKDTNSETEWDKEERRRQNAGD